MAARQAMIGGRMRFFWKDTHYGLKLLGRNPSFTIVSYAANQRTREIGLRMALGAQRRDALIMVLRQGLGMALLGTAIGMPMALTTSYYMRSALYGVSPADPTALSGTSLLLIAVALLASYIPALRATRVDPMVALRHS
jgi:putative ABC transport system permease protein